MSGSCLSSRFRFRHRSLLCSLAAAAITTNPARAEWILYFPWSAEDIAVGNGRMVACGWNTAGVYGTADGIQWTRLGENYQSGRSVCYGNGQFWITTAGSELWRTDGVSAPVLVTNQIPTSKIAFGKGRLIRGNSSGISYSTDGLDWQTAVVPVAGSYEMEIKCFGEFFVATSGASIITSPDGAIWTLRATGTGAAPKYIAFDGSTHVVISSGGTRQWRSTDGLTWTELAAGPGFTMGDLHFANGLFYAVGANGKISTSPDALSWTPQSSGVAVTLQTVNSIAGQVVVSGPNQLLRQSSTGSVPMPPITIHPAVEIEFHAENSVTYRIEGSADLSSWTAVETGILGHGAPVKRKYSSTGQPYGYFRAVAE
ncbi:hypothetical protein [Haloferula sp. BvORR071]|uniref:WD40/YVTN/BNR-like repeat-containing protein n=1 Tax=Haloferula sp. BvORR071 TaxID=1396141 RepID=UPI000555A683|nr:hypothetical protein [Haloferula sp. BvORR071]